jgi:hypothetical protein
MFLCSVKNILLPLLLWCIFFLRIYCCFYYYGVYDFLDFYLHIQRTHLGKGRMPATMLLPLALMELYQL